MKPSPQGLYLEPPVSRHLAPHDLVVAAQHLLHPLVPQSLGHLGGALNVAEEDGYRAVGSGPDESGQVGPFGGDR